jgi:hypothetical protein
MNCDAARNRLLTSDDPARPDADVAGHLDGCPSCQSLAADLAGLEESVRALPVPSTVLARRDAFLTNLASAGPRPIRVRHIAGAFAALAASVVVAVAAVAVLRPTHPDTPVVAQANPTVVEELVEWNLKLSEADEPADREKLVRERLPDFEVAVASAPLSADDRALAEQLLAQGRKFGAAGDPVDEAEAFHVLADTLLVKLDTSASDPDRSVTLAKMYTQVVDRGVDRNLERAERQALRAEKQARVQELRKAKKKQAARAAAVAERIPEPAREHLKGIKARPKASGKLPK